MSGNAARMVMLAAATIVAGAFAIPDARAVEEVIQWWFAYAGPKVSAQGTMTTPVTPEPDGSYRILSISGERNGQQIIELVPEGELVTGREFLFADNRLRVLPPFIGEAGFIYRTEDSGYFNVCHSEEGEWCNPAGYNEYSGSGKRRSIKLELSRAPLPEPAARDPEAAALVTSPGDGAAVQQAHAREPLAGLGTAAPAPDAAPPPGTVPAIWIEQKVSFNYFATTTHYSCDGLRDKIRWILRQLGVLDGSRVTVRSCDHSRGPRLAPLVRIELVVPQRVTPELLATLADSRSRRELLARVRNERFVVGNTEAQFPARTRRVAFDDDAWRSRIQPGDCELLAQLRDKVFVPLGMNIVEDRINCSPGHVVRGSIDIDLEVLEPWRDDSEPADPIAPDA